MWRRIAITNFRSIERAEVELAPFTLVVGPNGSGKSNFVDALVFARDVAVDAASAVHARGGIAGVRRWSRSKPYDVRIDVRASADQEGLDRTYVRHEFVLKSLKAPAWKFSRERVELRRDGKAALDWERTEDRIRGTDTGFLPKSVPPTTSLMLIARQLIANRRGLAIGAVRRIRLSPDAMRKPQPASEGQSLQEDGSNVAAAVAALLAEPAEELRLVLRTMARIVPGLVGLSTETNSRFHSLKFEQRNAAGVTAEFSASEMSEGSLRALGIVLAALQVKRNELLIIEEPEANLHPGAAAVIFDVLKEASKRGSVLVTTHSPEMLDAARDEEILVCEYENGATAIGPLAAEQRDAVRRGLLTAADLMRGDVLRREGSTPAVIVDHGD